MTRTESAELRKAWLMGLNKRDPNSVAQQLVQLLWSAAVYDLVVVMRSESPKIDGKRTINGPVHRMIDDNFWIAQGAGVRKLVDHGPWQQLGDRKDKSVWSLYSLLKDMKRKREVYFSRVSMFQAEGLEYFVDLAWQRHRAHLLTLPKGASAFFEPQDQDPVRLEERHQVIDSLTESSRERREAEDTVPEWVFCALIEKLDAATESITVMANKHMLHAASDQSRRIDDRYSPDMVVTHDELKYAHSVLCRTFRFITEKLLGDGEYDLLPQIHDGMFDHFENSDKVLNMRQKLWERWLGIEARIKSYTAWSMEDLSASWVSTDPHAKQC